MPRIGLSRQVLFAAPLVLLGGCQMSEERIYVSVRIGAEHVFVDAVREFARNEGYRFIESGQNFELVGWRSKVICSGAPGVGYQLSVQHKQDPWLLVIPAADLTEIADRVRAALAGREGVSVEAHF